MNDAVPERPLIDAVAPMSSLRSEYENGSPTFLKQIDWLMKHGFGHVRRTRGEYFCLCSHLLMWMPLQVMVIVFTDVKLFPSPTHAKANNTSVVFSTCICLCGKLDQ
jgi:hypothetical protein